MFSMTGYGKAEYSADGLIITAEIRTVNNRNFDFNPKIPRAFLAIEDKIRKIINSYISRGRVDLFLNFSDNREKPADISVDLNLASGYYQAAEKIAKNLDLTNDLTVSNILRMPDVLSDNKLSDMSELYDIVSDTVKTACENLNKMRETEGEKLISDMLARMDTIESLREKIIKRAPLVAIDYKQKLTQRIKEALSETQYDEARLLNEVAFFTDKSNIDEELTRLGSHISQFRDICKINGAGKKLDFLMQEFNRETNTICSKSNDIDITRSALELKNEIEKVREQVQNIE